MTTILRALLGCISSMVILCAHQGCSWQAMSAGREFGIATDRKGAPAPKQHAYVAHALPSLPSISIISV
jgi:hypothetical protein